MKRKWTFFGFGPGDYKGVEAYLNRQAAKGWELEKLVGVIACWRKTEHPSRWCVDLLIVRADREDKLDYLDLCAEGGWELVAMHGCMCIFRAAEGTEPFPIQTDPELEKKNYNRYYLRPAILSVAYIVVLLGGTVLGALANDRIGAALAELRYGWMEHWTVAALYLALPVWALMAVWKILHFLSSLVRNRRKITAPSVEAMWIHSVLVLLSTILGVGVSVALAADKIFGTLDSFYLFVLLGAYAIGLSYRRFTIERELYRGEKRRTLGAGIACLVLLALLITADVVLPYKEWYTAWYSSNEVEAMAVYEETLELPLVHGEDLGIFFDKEAGETVDISRKYTPMGESWELEYHYGEEKATYAKMGVGSLTVTAPSRWQARRQAKALADGMGVTRHEVWSQDELSPVEIPWADEAWHRTCPVNAKGGTADILVVRIGNQVTRLILPAELMTEENLTAIYEELTR